MDDEERVSDEEAAEAYKQYLWERDFIRDNERISKQWDELVAYGDDRRKEMRETA